MSLNGNSLSMALCINVMYKVFSHFVKITPKSTELKSVPGKSSTLYFLNTVEGLELYSSEFPVTVCNFQEIQSLME